MESNGDTFDKEGKKKRKYKTERFLVSHYRMRGVDFKGKWLLLYLETWNNIILNLDKTLDIILLELSSFSENK